VIQARAIFAVAAAVAAIAPAARAAPFTEADLDALLAAHPVETINQLVPLLPDDLRENFTFVYESRSPFRDDITPDRPRVILFSEDATFLATFVTDGTGRDLLETLSFDRQSATFTPRIRALPAAVRAGARPERLEAECPRCHGADARPIFDSYPTWPGFYGSIQDTFPPELPSARKERARYIHFLRTSAQRPPYRDLRWVLGSPVSPFTDPRHFASGSVRAVDDELVYEPNTRLGMALTELNRQRIFRKLAAAPGFEEIAPRLASGLLGCNDPAGVELDGERALAAATAMENRARLTRLGIDPRGPVHYRFQMQEMTQLRNLAQIDRLAREAGVSRADWSMALEPYALSFFDGILAADGRDDWYLTEDLLFPLLAHLARTRPALRPYFHPRPSFPALGFPFGNKLDRSAAEAACPSLR
jgi:hypothetical protein